MLNAEIMARYALAKDWRSAGFHETENHRQIGRAVRAGLGSGRLIAITGPIGVGKTVFLHRLQDEIASEKKVVVAESLSVDTNRTTVPTLIAALFYDLSPEKDLKIPTQGKSANASCESSCCAAASRWRCSSMKPTTCTAEP